MEMKARKQRASYSIQNANKDSKSFLAVDLL